MLPPDAIVKSAAGLTSAVLAGLVLLPDPRDRTARWLAIFFALIAANQGAEVLRSVAADPTTPYRVATVFASFDPAVLLVFAHLLVGREPSRRALALAFVPAVALALAAGWALPPYSSAPSAHVLPFLLAAYTCAIYSWVFVLAISQLRREPASAQWRAFAPAAAIVALPSFVSAFDEATYAAPETLRSDPRAKLAGTALVVLLVVAGAWLHSRAGKDDAARRPLTLGIAAALALVALSRLFLLVSAATGVSEEALPDELEAPGRSVASIRWLVVGALVSTAVFHERSRAVDVRARRQAARGFVALTFLVATVVLLDVLAEVTGLGAPRGIEVVVLLLALALSQGFRRLVDGAAARIYGVPPLKR